MRDVWAGLLGRWTWDWFITFTFRTEVHPEAADKRFRAWLDRVAEERRRCGMFDAGLRWVRALEYQKRGVLHYHVLLGEVGPLPYRVVHDHWREGHAWVEPVRDSSAVRNYVAKYVTKGGELEIGGAGMPEAPRLTWPSRMCSRSKVRHALAPLSQDERHDLLHWVGRDGRPSTRPDELLKRARVACERYLAERRVRASRQIELLPIEQTSLARLKASARVSGPEADGSGPQRVCT
jgi:hypothetical protein